MIIAWRCQGSEAGPKYCSPQEKESSEMVSQVKKPNGSISKKEVRRAVEIVWETHNDAEARRLEKKAGL